MIITSRSLYLTVIKAFLIETTIPVHTMLIYLHSIQRPNSCNHPNRRSSSYSMRTPPPRNLHTETPGCHHWYHAARTLHSVQRPLERIIMHKQPRQTRQQSQVTRNRALQRIIRHTQILMQTRQQSKFSRNRALQRNMMHTQVPQTRQLSKFSRTIVPCCMVRGMVWVSAAARPFVRCP